MAAQDRWARPWWRPLTYSAAALTAIAALFQPLPASAEPAVPAPPASSVPDAGSRPVPLGTLLMPGQKSGNPAAGIPITAPSTLPGVPMTPLLQKIEKQRTAIAELGDKLIKLGEDRDLARKQVDTAAEKVTGAQVAQLTAQQDAAAAAAAALREQAALPPGAVGSGLADLEALSGMQRGDAATQAAADRQLALVQAALTAAQAEQATATTNYTSLAGRWQKLNADIARKQATLQRDESKHAEELSAAEAAQTAEDRRLGERYLDGTDQGRGADPKAIEALRVALQQIGDPYVWSEEGPDRFDCSGLTFYAYRSPKAGNYPLARVSRDQYKQTSRNLVDRYSLVPGDLLFFSSTLSWTSIHHVAMYAGKGMMVEAPRTGLDVRLTPVRWSRLFGATRIYGSVDHPTKSPDLDHLPKPAPNPKPKPSKPTTTPKPPTKPSTSASTPDDPPSNPGSPSESESSSSTPPEPGTSNPDNPGVGSDEPSTPASDESAGETGGASQEVSKTTEPPGVSASESADTSQAPSASAEASAEAKNSA